MGYVLMKSTTPNMEKNQSYGIPRDLYKYYKKHVEFALLKNNTHLTISVLREFARQLYFNGLGYYSCGIIKYCLDLCDGNSHVYRLILNDFQLYCSNPSSRVSVKEESDSVPFTSLQQIYEELFLF